MSIGALAITSTILQWVGLELVPKLVLPRPGRAVRIVDRRAAPKVKLAISQPSPRPLRKVRSVVTHQLDVELGLRPYQIKEAGGDETEALIRRAMRLPYHVVALRCGVVLLNHEPTIRTSHAERGNDGIGVGIEGSFPTLAKDRTDKHTPIEAVADVAVVALREAVRLIAEPGKTIEWQAHRQWSSGRTRDPGEELWRLLRPVADELGLVMDPEPRRRQEGRPIPVEWDERARYDLMGQEVDRVG